MNEVEMLPRALKAWRGVRELSQKELAVGAAVSPTLIALIETGERQPGLANALNIADALGVELEAIAIVRIDLERLDRPATPDPVQPRFDRRSVRYDDSHIRAAAERSRSRGYRAGAPRRTASAR